MIVELLPYYKVSTSIGSIIYELTLVQEPISIARVTTINIVRDTNSDIPLKRVKIKMIESFLSQLQSYKTVFLPTTTCPTHLVFTLPIEEFGKTLHISHITL